jgi:hypothetical protein
MDKWFGESLFSLVYPRLVDAKVLLADDEATKQRVCDALRFAGERFPVSYSTMPVNEIGERFIELVEHASLHLANRKRGEE